MSLAAPKLDARLATAAEYVRGGRLADVGTDHAYLPVAMVLVGRSSDAVASDVRQGPLERARQTVERYGVAERVSLVLTDGLNGIERYSPDDIAIFGMGGELIASIIEAADWTRDPRVRLILQPMTRRAELRRYLTSHGFGIEDEAMSLADGRIYQTICAAYTGHNTEYTPAEYELGRCNINKGGELYTRYLGQQCRHHAAILDARGVDRLSDDPEAVLLRQLEKLNGEINI